MVKYRFSSAILTSSLCMALLLGVLPAGAATPSAMSIHGQLLDGSGLPLSGNRAWQVRFFGAQTGGAQLGATLTGAITVSAEGVFDIPVTPPQEALLAAQPWYELAVDGTPAPNGVDANDVFPQRVALYSVPFALEANHVALSGVGAGTVSDAEFGALDGITGGIQSQINLKANTADVYTKTQVDASQTAQDTLIAAKANTADTYSKTAVDTAIAAKANTADVYTKTQVDTSLTTQTAAIAGKANAADVYTKAEVDAAQAAQNTSISSKANASNVYTKSQVNTTQAAQDTLIAAKANTADVYTKAEVDGKQFIWTVVDGADAQAEANHGYIVTDTAERSIILPLTDSLAVGDIVRVTGAGTGGWRLQQRDAQQIYTASLQIPNSMKAWMKYVNPSAWRGVASSADGTKLAACAAGGQIYFSADAGVTWTPRGPSGLDWRCIASSADGNKLVAGTYGGKLYVSTDSGATWTPRGDDLYWMSVASSADGATLLAGVNGGKFYVSTDSGETWTPHGTNLSWSGADVSADGTILVAAAAGEKIMISTDSGATWNGVNGTANLSWGGVAVSDDGTKIVGSVWNMGLFTSTDSGATWTNTCTVNNLGQVACSADGAKWVTTSWNNGQIYMSTDSGATWTPTAVNNMWQGVAASDDFNRIVAVANADGIYHYGTTITQTTIGATGWLSGGARTAVELQYIGDGAFMPISHEGTMGAN